MSVSGATWLRARAGDVAMRHAAAPAERYGPGTDHAATGAHEHRRDQARFDGIFVSYRRFPPTLGYRELGCLPVQSGSKDVHFIDLTGQAWSGLRRWVLGGNRRCDPARVRYAVRAGSCGGIRALAARA